MPVARTRPCSPTSCSSCSTPSRARPSIDCTFGDGGHARLRRRAARRDGHAGRDRPRPARRGALRRARAAGGAARCASSAPATPRRSSCSPGRACAPTAAYFDLGMSSMQVDTRERGFSYSYEAPLDMRMDPTQELSAREIVATWDERRLAHAPARLRRGAPRGRDRPRDRPPPRAGADRDDARARRHDQLGDPGAGPLRRRPSRQARPSRRCGSPSTTSSDSSTARCRSPGGCCAREACWPAISFHSLEDRRVKRFLAERARGCICPPDLPVCALRARARGGAARAPLDRALRARRSPRNPRAASARLRAARKLSDGEGRSHDAAGRRRPGRPAPALARAGPPAHRRPEAPARLRSRAAAARRPAGAHGARARAGRPRARRARGARAGSPQHRLLDRLIRGRTWIGARRIRADRDRDAAARAAEAQRGHRPRARARGHCCSARTPRSASKTPNWRPATRDRGAAPRGSAWKCVPIGALRFLAAHPRDRRRLAARPRCGTPVAELDAGEPANRSARRNRLDELEPPTQSAPKPKARRRSRAHPRARRRRRIAKPPTAKTGSPANRAPQPRDRRSRRRTVRLNERRRRVRRRDRAGGSAGAPKRPAAPRRRPRANSGGRRPDAA